MKHLIPRLSILLAASFLLTGCPDRKPTETADTRAPARLPRAPAFNADSAYAFTAKQVAFGPRVPSTSCTKVR